MAEPVVVSEVVLGPVTVEISATQGLRTHGSMASRHAKVRSWVTEIVPIVLI